MTIGEQLIFIRAGLRAWVEDIKGRVEVAADPLHALGLLATAPGAPRVVVMFDAEVKRGDFEETGRVDRQYLLIVSRGRGFKLDPGDALLEGVAGGKPLYDLVEEGREVIRALVFTEDESTPNYLAARRVKLEDLTVDAYQLEFSVGTQLPIHT
jgi:hypothetical protein